MKLRIRNGRAVREAAIFEYPPAMFKEIQKWMLATYAGHVWALADQKLKRLTAYADEVNKSIAEAEKWLKDLPGWVKKAKKVGKVTKVYVGPPGQGYWQGVKLHDLSDYGHSNYFLWGMSDLGKSRIKWDDPTESLQDGEIVPFAKRMVANAIQAAERRKLMVLQSEESKKQQRSLPGQRRKQDEELVTLHLVIKEAKKHASKAKAYKTKATASFLVDLQDWKYLKDYHEEAQRELKDLIAKNEQVLKNAIAGVKALKTEGQQFESGTFWVNPTWGQKIKVTLQAEGKYGVELTTTNQNFAKWIPKYASGNTPTEIVNATLAGQPGVKDVLKKMKEGLQSASEAAETYAKKLSQQGWGRPPKIEVVLYFDPHQRRGGQWSIQNKQIEVDVMLVGPLRDVENFKYGIDKINRTLEHELQHAGQDILRQIKELKEDAGLPSRKVRQPDANPSGFPLQRVEDRSSESRRWLRKMIDQAKTLKPGGRTRTRAFPIYLPSGRKVDFYIRMRENTILGRDEPKIDYLLYEGDSYAGDYATLKELRKFVEDYYIKPAGSRAKDPMPMWQKPRIEHPLRDVEFHTDLGNAVSDFMRQIPGVAQRDWRAFFQAFVGSKASSKWNTNWYFKSWKKNRAKWKNAVREFYKAVKQRGFDAPEEGLLP